VGLSLPVVSPATGDVFSTLDVCNVQVDIPTLRLTYKTANPIKIEIYRWSTKQQIFYEVTPIATPLLNDTTIDFVSFVDTTPDNQISGNAAIYTTGGVIENIGAPSFNSITLFDDRLWGIDAEDTNLLWFSKQVIETTPVEMSDLLTIYVAPSIAAQGSTGQLKCLFPMDDKLILFKNDAMYFINGTGPDNAGGNNQYSPPTFITSVAGCSNPKSIVFTDKGLLFQSDKGIWLLSRNGIDVLYKGAEVEKYTLNSLVNSASVIPGTTQVRLTMDSGVTLVYDYYYDQWSTFTGIPAISSTVYGGLHTYLDASGNVFRETPNVYMDAENPVSMKFTTSWINIAGLQGYQRCYFMFLLGKYLSPHKILLNIAYDYTSSSTQQFLIEPTNYNTAYGYGADETPYGHGNPYGGPKDIERRKVPFERQKCQAIQITFQEIFDETYGTVPGSGLTLSGISLIAAFKKSYKPVGIGEIA
jgi:hypothetical protein